MRWIIMGSIMAVGTFPTKAAARVYIDNEHADIAHTLNIVALLPPKPPENGQLPL